ncbi:helix-turn-helix domain-containing protein [Metabacillus halosaccharovorans]|uniref:helix-turn-helix domain-containing protein n=1 Tax=Metabacillus halosaccharovorans TaxID=930124 RepID=UPI0020400726|nr:helix-turn-helix domain-containing protein [Metabacillus halosaccharovorans]MCM3444504.1 helix-turn-helix domain-containing protein [Metabacillus halosaccharovorans]
MKVLTVNDVSELLKLSKCKVYALAKEGEIPTVKIGGSIRVIQEELENFLKGGEVK